MPDIKLQKYISIILALCLFFILLFMPGFVTLAQTNLLLKIQVKNQEIINQWPEFREKALEFSMDAGVNKNLILKSNFIKAIEGSFVHVKIFRDENSFWQDTLYKYFSLKNPTIYCKKLSAVYLRAIRTINDFGLGVLAEDPAIQRLKLILKEIAHVNQEFSVNLVLAQKKMMWFQFLLPGIFSLIMLGVSFYLFRKIRYGIHLNSTIIFRELGFPLKVASLLQLDFEDKVNEHLINIRKELKNKADKENRTQEILNKLNFSDAAITQSNDYNNDSSSEEHLLLALKDWEDYRKNSNNDKLNFKEILKNQKQILQSAIEKWETLLEFDSLENFVNEFSKENSLDTGSDKQKNNIENVNNKTDLNKLKITLINIAENAHILGLNAHIEAARAGEMGKAFSVIAGDIRKLAERMEKMAKNLEVNISKINLGSKIHNNKMLRDVNNKNVNKVEDTIKKSAAFSRQIIDLKEAAMETRSVFSNLLSLHESSVELLGQGSDNLKPIFTELEKLLHNYKNIKINLKKNNSFLESQEKKVKEIKSILSESA